MPRGNRGGSYPKRGHQQQYRGRGRGRGGRGRGRGQARGGGRGRNRQLFPTAVGYVYQPTSTYEDDDLEDDFRIFGQFTSDEESETDDDMQVYKSKSKKRHAKTKRRVLDHRPFVPASNTVVNEESVVLEEEFSRLGLGASSSAAAQPCRSKNGSQSTSYKTTIAFTRSSVGLNMDPPEQLAEKDRESPTVSSANVVTSNIAQNKSIISSNTTSDQHNQDNNSVKDLLCDNESCTEEGGDQLLDANRFSKDNRHLDSLSDEEEEDDDDDDAEFDEDDFDEEDDLELMRDYIENITLDDEEIARILSRSEDDPWVMDHFDDDAEDDLEEEERLLLQEGEYDSDELMELEDADFDPEDAEISIDAFRQSLQNAMNDVPPSLKPGMRNWISHEKKNDKKMQKKKQRAEKKQKRLERKLEKKNKKDSNNYVSLEKIDARILAFLDDDTITSYQFAPMNKNCRRHLHLLASAYNLKSSSIGTGVERSPVISKTERTFIPTDRRYINRFIQSAQDTLADQRRISEKTNAKSYLAFNNDGRRGKNGKKKDKSKSDAKKKKKDDTKAPAGPAHGTVVGAGVAPIDEGNRGHRMLAAMGWRQGDALGVNNTGITAPIEAVIRKKNLGLGS
ncbi:uncharacterized protein BYT42DRAFT_568465 [Radiomyces spectabilis]|uniref:uncharacterized protein n=1 Tax=Radiomyces spectabilis TaxID=64574 RepID=UPI00221FEE3E|nr:uncharacterized protein BYT42DRAFT_568465 [Radiomyces spectabilis]KAI8379339.1 hypothetical protein BYT42DRAFT_568465 [Radiomyces spectabilis]